MINTTMKLAYECKLDVLRYKNIDLQNEYSHKLDVLKSKNIDLQNEYHKANENKLCKNSGDRHKNASIKKYENRRCNGCFQSMRINSLKVCKNCYSVWCWSCTNTMNDHCRICYGNIK